MTIILVKMQKTKIPYKMSFFYSNFIATFPDNLNLKLYLFFAVDIGLNHLIAYERSLYFNALGLLTDN